MLREFYRRLEWEHYASEAAGTWSMCLSLSLLTVYNGTFSPMTPLDESISTNRSLFFPLFSRMSPEIGQEEEEEEVRQRPLYRKLTCALKRLCTYTGEKERKREKERQIAKAGLRALDGSSQPQGRARVKSSRVADSVRQRRS